MLIVATGISGSGRKEYWDTLCQLAERNGKRVKNYQVGQLMMEKAAIAQIPMTPINVLNSNPNVIKGTRATAFEEIINEIERSQDNNDLILIDVHCFFYWNKVFIRAYNGRYLGLLKPDMFITMIDNAVCIKDRLAKNEQWESQHLTLEEILLWQNIEVESTAFLAETHQKPHFIVGTKQNPETVYRVIFEPDVMRVYISMPMTHLSQEGHAKVTNFVKRLDQHFAVFDPRSIEINTGAPNGGFNEVDYNQTVHRDLYWLLPQVQANVAFYPEIVSSPGLINELRESYETNLETWLIYPQGIASPFITYYAKRIFIGEDEFFKFLAEKYPLLKPLK